MKTTVDQFLGGRLSLEQPEKGYRAGMDAVFLASCVQAAPNDQVLDVGCGVGTALLCLAARVPELRLTGLEINQDMMRLALQNVQRNNLEGMATILQGNLLKPPPRLAPSTFHHVMTNPPFFRKEGSTISPLQEKTLARIEGEVSLEEWVLFCLLMLRPQGILSLIFSTDRLDELLSLLYGKVGDIKLYPLWPGSGKPAKRILIQGRKGIKSVLKLLPGLLVNNDIGKSTPEADAILRKGNGLIF